MAYVRSNGDIALCLKTDSFLLTYEVQRMHTAAVLRRVKRVTNVIRGIEGPATRRHLCHELAAYECSEKTHTDTHRQTDRQTHNHIAEIYKTGHCSASVVKRITVVNGCRARMASSIQRWSRDSKHLLTVNVSVTYELLVVFLEPTQPR